MIKKQLQLNLGVYLNVTVKHSRRRAHDDARAIINALSVGELVSGGLTGVEVLSVMRASHTVDELAEGRVLSRLTLQVTIVVDNA